MQTLKLRQTSRSFDSKPLPLQELSNLLWAADGINRPDSGRRTAPSAKNVQEVDVYLALPGALYLYEAKTHSLTPVVVKDLRAATGRQDFVKDAPLNLVYVAGKSENSLGARLRTNGAQTDFSVLVANLSGDYLFGFDFAGQIGGGRRGQVDRAGRNVFTWISLKDSLRLSIQNRPY
jgi:hypothetical protein